MAGVRWSRRARGELRASIAWLNDNRSPELAGRASVDVSNTVARIAADPDRYAWVGSVYPALVSLPRNVRRAVTRTGRHIIFYRFDETTDTIQMLAVRGKGQLPPSPATLQRRAGELGRA